MNNINDKDNTSNLNTEHRYAQSTKSKSSMKYGRFNFIDFCLIIIIIAMIATLIVYFLPNITSGFSDKDEVDLIYVIEFSGIDSEFITNIKSQDAVYDATQNYQIGTVKTVENDNYNVLVYNELTEAAEMKSHPELKNIIVTVECKAIYSEREGYLVNGQRIAVGRKYNLRFPSFLGSGYCIDVYTYDSQ